MIHKYLKELVENNNRIIIPDFGAFMVQDTPTGKQISFNDFLKFNDGLLINQVIKSEKISKNEATEQINEFIKNIEGAFSKGESYEIKEVGFLTKDTNGNIKFELKAEDKKAEVKPTDPKPTIVLDEKVEAKKTAIPAAKVEPKKAEVKKDIPTKKVEKPIEPIAKAETSKPEASAAPKIATPSASTKKPLTKIPSKPANPANTPPKQANKPSTTVKTTTNNSKSKLPIIIAAAVLVIAALGFTAYKMNWFGIGQQAPVVEVIPMEQPIIDSVETSVDTVIQEEPTVIEEPTIDANVKRYYIIAGSFKVVSNAENFKQKLIDEGYDSEIVVRNNGYHIVSYKTLFEWNEALTEWRQMRNTNNETWILVK